MNVIRSHARLTPGVRRLLLAAPIALAIITGLLSMHILTGSHQPALASETSAMSTHSQVGSAPAAADDTPMTAALPKGALWAKPEAIANGIVRAIERERDEVYLPGFWWMIMAIIRHVPERAFKRLSL